MAGFNFEKQNQYNIELGRIYDRQNDEFKRKISKEDFRLSFVILEQNGRGVHPNKPENSEISDRIYSEVERAFEKIYR